MRLAKNEANKFNNEYIGTEHVLLGLLEIIRSELSMQIEIGSEKESYFHVPYTARVKEIIIKLEGKEIKLGDILLELVNSEEGLASQVLRKLEISQVIHARSNMAQ
jgi:ATP-dependent Clp protease ATP-binding subunit ClpC